jgi:hypothetical protein
MLMIKALTQYHAIVEDKEKLLGVLRYLKATQGQTHLLHTCVGGNIIAYVDAAYALHQDSKSHTGVIVYVGGTLVLRVIKKTKKNE